MHEHHNTAHNVNNLLLTVAKKIQINTGLHFLTQDVLTSDHELLNYENIRVEEIKEQQIKTIINAEFNVHMVYDVFKVLIKNVLYEIGYFIEQRVEDNIFISRIEKILFIKGNVYFYVRVYEHTYVAHYHSFSILPTIEYKFIDSKKLYDYRPFNSFTLATMIDNRIFVKPNSYFF
jgi:hypothetical protein